MGCVELLPLDHDSYLLSRGKNDDGVQLLYSIALQAVRHIKAEHGAHQCVCRAGGWDQEGGSDFLQKTGRVLQRRCKISKIGIAS